MAGQLRLGRPRNLPRRALPPAAIDLADIQGNVLRGYTFPSAAYLFLRIDDVERARALLTRALPHVATAEPWTDGADDGAARRVHLRRAAGARGARRDARQVPATSSARAWRRARAGSATAGRARPSSWEAGLGHRRGARARHGLRRSTRSTSSSDSSSCAGWAARPARRRRSTRRAPRRCPAGATTSASTTGSPSRPSRAAACAPAPATASPTAPAAGATCAPASSCTATSTRTARCRRRRPRRSIATARSRSGASCTWTSPRSGATSTSAGACTPAGPSCWRPRSSGAGATARRSALARRAACPRSPPTPSASTTSPSPTRPGGLRCPVGAHIRRANPRDADGFFDGRLTNRHRIIRRGRPYGPELPDGALEDDGVDRGLVFVCFNASIWRQFETIQALWIDDGDPFGLGADKDFLIGEPEGDAGKMTIPGHPPFFLKPQPRFVTVRGGEYLFRPSMNALRWLAAGAGGAG